MVSAFCTIFVHTSIQFAVYLYCDDNDFVEILYWHSPHTLSYLCTTPTVLFGADNGLQTVLVLSGVTTEEKLLSTENTITPDYYADTINDFFTPSEAKVTES